MPMHEVVLAEDSPLGKAGQRVTLALTPTDVQDSSEIPTYLAGYKPFGFRGSEAAPEILVGPSVGKYRTFNSDDAFVPVKVKGSLQSAIPEVDPNSALEDYAVGERFIGSFMPTSTEREATYDLRAAAGRKCRLKIDHDYERDVLGSSGLLTTSSNWNSAVRTAVAVGSEWDVSGNPIRVIQTAIEKSFQPITDVWFNQRVAHAFLRHTEVRDHMRQMMGDAAVQGMVASVDNSGAQNVDFKIPGLPPFRVVASKQKDSVGGSMDYIMPNVVVLGVRLPSGIPNTGEEIQTAACFRRKGDSGVGWQTREYFVDGRGPEGGTMLVTTVADVLKMTSNVAGGIITNVLAA